MKIIIFCLLCLVLYSCNIFNATHFYYTTQTGNRNIEVLNTDSFKISMNLQYDTYLENYNYEFTVINLEKNVMIKSINVSNIEDENIKTLNPGNLPKNFDNLMFCLNDKVGAILRCDVSLDLFDKDVKDQIEYHIQLVASPKTKHEPSKKFNSIITIVTSNNIIYKRINFLNLLKVIEYVQPSK